MDKCVILTGTLLNYNPEYTADRTAGTSASTGTGAGTGAELGIREVQSEDCYYVYQGDPEVNCAIIERIHHRQVHEAIVARYFSCRLMQVFNGRCQFALLFK